MEKFIQYICSAFLFIRFSIQIWLRGKFSKIFLVCCLPPPLTSQTVESFFYRKLLFCVLFNDRQFSLKFSNLQAGLIKLELAGQLGLTDSSIFSSKSKLFLPT